MHLAAAEGHLDCVQFLLEHCHVPHDPKGKNKFKIKFYLKPISLDRWGNTPLDEAETFNHMKVVEYLTNFQAKTDSTNENGKVTTSTHPYPLNIVISL